MNVDDCNLTTDADAEAMSTLSGYLEPLNAEGDYQLTAKGPRSVNHGQPKPNADELH